MTSINWKSGVNGSWDTAASWSGGAVPDATSAVNIAAAGSYIIQMANAESVASLVLNAAGAEINDTSGQIFSVGTSMTINAGTFALSSGSQILETGGTLKEAAGGMLLANGGNNQITAGTITLAGMTQVTSGILGLNGSGTLGGTLTGSGTLELGSGTFALASGTAEASTLHLLVNGATLTDATTTGLAAPIQLIQGGTLSIAKSTSLNLIGGLTVGQALLNDGNNAISGPGTLATAGTTEINASTQPELMIAGGLTWSNTGTINADGSGGLAGGSKIVNAANAHFNFSSDGTTLTSDGNAANLFTNAGTITKTSATSNSQSEIDSQVNSTGLIEIDAGTLTLGGGGSVAGTVSGVGTLLLSNGSFNIGATSGSGHIVMGAGASLGFNATELVANAFTLDHGETVTVAAGVNATLSGQITIGDATGGANLPGPGTLTTSGAVTIADLGGSPAIALQGGTWVNTGTVVDAGAGNLNTPGVDGATVTIVNSGSFTFSGADAGFTEQANGTDIFSNTGTLLRTGPAGSTTFVEAALNTTGMVNVSAGTLEFRREGGSLAGTLSGAGTLALGLGSFTTTGLAGTGTLAVTGDPSYLSGLLTATATASITDSVLINDSANLAVVAGANLTLSGPVTIGNIQGGAILDGPGTLTTSGAVTIADLGGSPAIALQGGTWVNTGTVVDAGAGNLNTPGVDGATVTIVNSGSFTFSGADAGFTEQANGTDIFSNTGTLLRTGPAGSTTFVEAALNTTGMVNVSAGTLEFRREGGSLAGTLSGAGTLALGLGSFTTTGLAGTGTLAVTGDPSYLSGLLTATATASITDSVLINDSANLAVVAGANLTLSGPVTIGNIQGGAILDGPGTLTTSGAVTIADLGGSPAIALQGGTWVNTGTVVDAGAGNLNTPGVDGATVTIVNSGSFTFSGADAGFTEQANGTDIFSNTGTLLRTGPAGSTTFVEAALNTTGMVNVSAGTLEFRREGGSLAGTLSGAGTLALGLGSFTTTGLAGTGTLAVTGDPSYLSGLLTATATASITDSVLINDSANLAVVAGANLTLSGPVTIGNIQGGAILDGPGTLTTSGAVTIADLGGSPAIALQGGTWVNTGTVVDAGAGNLNTPGVDGATVTIVNSGSFTLAGPDAGFGLVAGGTDSFINNGALVRTGTGVSSLDSRIAVTNTGTIEAAGGTLVLGAIAGTGTLRIDAGATLEIGAAPLTQAITFKGGAGATLKQDAPISRALTGFSAGDRLDFTGLTASSATITGTTLKVVTASSTYTFTSAGLNGFVASIQADGSGGSLVSIDRSAVASHTPEPLAFGNHHVGDSSGNTLTLTVSNIATADGYSEKLNASLGAATAGFTASGAINGIAAGASNSTALKAVLNTTTAGSLTGTASLTLASNGSGVDGRGNTPLATQTVNLNGAVYAYAAGTLASSAVALGNHHVGDKTSALLTVSNTAAATGGYTEALDAAFTGTSGSATATGSASLIGAGASNSVSLSVGLSPATGGVASGTATLTYVSDGAGTSGLGTTTLGTQAVSITGTYFNLAAATPASTVIAFGNHHVGDIVAAQTLGLTNSATAGAYSEALDASVVASGALTATGTISGLLAGSTDGTTLKIGETAAASGAITGNLVLGLTSDGTVIGDGLGTTNLAGQTISVTGANYAYAVGQASNAGTLNLGVIHASTLANGALALTNGAASGPYSEALDAGLSGASAGLSTSGSITGLLAGGTDVATLILGVNTAVTGAYTGTATLNLASDGTTIGDGLGTTSLTGQTVTVLATVDNYALAAFEDPSGPALTGTSVSQTLNLGSVVQGASALSVSLGVLNAASGLADLLGGTLTSAGAAGFTNSNFGTFGGLGAGQDEHAQIVSLSTSTVGTFSETVVLSSTGTNASGYSGALTTETLTITGTVTPSTFTTYTLDSGPNVILGADGRGDIFQATAGSLNSRDQLTGGNGANSVNLIGGGTFDVNALRVFANIPTLNASEGQAASGTLAGTVQTILMTDGADETLNVAAGNAAAGNNNAETIRIYGSSSTNTYNLASGSDKLILAGGHDTINLGGSANSVTAGTGMALVRGTAAAAGGAVVGNSSSTTLLEITGGGTATLNAADTNITVQLDAAGTLKLSAMGFITAIGSAGNDTITALGGTQTLTGGLGNDTLMGFTGGNDTFADTAAGLNGDTIKNWTVGDIIDLKNVSAATIHALSFASNTLTVTDGTNTSAIKFAPSQAALHNFAVLGTDGNGGTLIGYHT